MSKIIKAIVLTNSSDDTYNRVKLKSENIWVESGLISSNNGIPLSRNDTVYVDVSEGYNNPMIIGRAVDANSNTHVALDSGTSLLFESSNREIWTIAFVKNNILNIVNSNQTSIKVDGANIIINGGENRGMVKIIELTNKINQLIAWAKIHTHSIPAGAMFCGGDPNSAGFTIKPVIEPSNFDLTDYENTRIKH